MKPNLWQQLHDTSSKIKAIRDLNKDNKGIPDDKKPELEKEEKTASELRDKQQAIITWYVNFNSGTVRRRDYGYRSYGQSVRPVSE